MIERLNWVMARLQKLQDEERVRSEGNQIFQEAKAELADVIATYVAPAALAPVVEQRVMTAEQVAAVLAEVRAELEESDVAVLGAIAQSQLETIAALTPQPA